MTHPSRDDLLQWRDAGEAGARAGLLAHLAVCEDCRRAYSDLVRTEPVPADAAGIDATVFIRRGLKVYGGPAAPAWWKRRAVWLGIPAAAAAAVFLAVNIPRRPAPFTEPSTEIRGSSIAPMFPVGTLARVTEFRWSSPVAAAGYRVIVRDSSGRDVLRRETGQDSIAIDPATSASIGAGSYTWVVEAYDRSGRVVMVSRPQTFQLR